MLPDDWEIVDAVARKSGNGRSSALRLIVRSHPVAEQMVVLGQSLLLGVVTPEEAIERLQDLAAEVPLPIALTEAGREVIAQKNP